MLDAGVIPSLVHLLLVEADDVHIKIKAAWAISNATSGGTPDQIKFLVQQGCIPPLCELLVAQDSKIVKVALEVLGNMLMAGHADDSAANGQPNPVAQAVLEAGGLGKIESIRDHEVENSPRAFPKGPHFLLRLGTQWVLDLKTFCHRAKSRLFLHSA